MNMELNKYEILRHLLMHCYIVCTCMDSYLDPVMLAHMFTLNDTLVAAIYS